MAVKKSVLRRSSFFRALNNRELESLAFQSDEAHYPARATLFSDQQLGEFFYLLQAGSVEIFKLTSDGEVRLNVLQPGDHFGEMSLLDKQPRSATARAATDVTVIQVPKAVFLPLVKRFPILLYQAARVGDERLRQRDQKLIQELTVHNQQLERLYDTSLDISRHRELDPALSAIVERAAVLFDSPEGQLYLFDEKTHRLISPKGRPIGLGVGVTGRAFASGAPVIQNGTGRHNPSRELAAPICLDGKSLGAITVCRPKTAVAFTRDDAKLLLLFANQAAIAIENARLYGLAVEKGQLDGELSAARQVQRSLLPTRPPRIPGFQLAGLWQPAREVAGDFYDFIPLGKSKWGIVIADVSDKGVPAALFMAITRSVLRASIVGDLDLGRALGRANRLLSADAADGMFVTVFLAILDVRARRFTYANAGHNPPLLWRAHTKRLERLHHHGLALGIEPSYAFAAHTLELRAGDVLVLYTDGVTDAANERAQSFGERRLIRLIQSNARAGAPAITRAIDHAVRDFTGAHALFDDVAAVALSVTRSPRR
jgi:serine phosphatase RsbU (regulator of sigma subunit)/CRP-like cAMP-binding protein